MRFREPWTRHPIVRESLRARKSRTRPQVDALRGTLCVREQVPLLTRDGAFGWVAEVAPLRLVVPVGH